MNAPDAIDVLLVDDDEQFRSAQIRNLRRLIIKDEKPIQIHQAGSGKEAMAIIENGAISCVLLDYNMPGGSGIDWLKKFLAKDPDLAIIMVTGQGSEQLAVEAMKQGASDYLVKGSITPHDVERAIINAVEKVRLKTTIRNLQDKLLKAERQRVMIESLGAACHHIGQPATVISGYLQFMQDQSNDAEMQNMISTCMKASDEIAAILRKLQLVSQYRTKPYITCEETGSSQILDIDS